MKEESEIERERESRSFAERFGVLLKVLSIICAMLLIALAVYKFTRMDLTEPMTVILPIYYIGFGCLMIAIELDIGVIMRNMLILKSYCFRGVFYILIGILCIHKKIVFEYVVTSVLVVVGVIYMCCLCSQRKKEYETV